MTCYETLSTPAPAADAPMAHHFVKWWRNKFRNGYKKFSLGTESDRTDTEELVDRAVSQCSTPPDLLPTEARATLQPCSSPQPRCFFESPFKSLSSTSLKESDDKQPRMRFEELTCDVELQHPKSLKQQPRQFSFTLYDLDGHGRMTKDDIAGIVSTIYESIGKSVTLPHYGSKTIQVRLTIIPEDINPKSHWEKRDCSRRRRRKECAHYSDDELVDKLSADEDGSFKSSCSRERKPPRHNHSRPHRYARRERRDRKHGKKRSGSLQRRELLEIIQANMEKNHMSFQASRKPCNPDNEEGIKSKYHKIRNRSHTVTERPKADKIKSETHSNGDLGGGGDSHLCRYDRYLHAVMCSSARHASSGYHQKQSRPPRPPRASRIQCGRFRSHDLSAHTQATQQPRVLQIIFL